MNHSQLIIRNQTEDSTSMQRVKSYSELIAKISLPSSYLRSCVGVLQAVVVVTDVIEIAIIFYLPINKSSNNNRTNSIDTFHRAKYAKKF